MRGTWPGEALEGRRQRTEHIKWPQRRGRSSLEKQWSLRGLELQVSSDTEREAGSDLIHFGEKCGFLR